VPQGSAVSLALEVLEPGLAENPLVAQWVRALSTDYGFHHTPSMPTVSRRFCFMTSFIRMSWFAENCCIKRCRLVFPSSLLLVMKTQPCTFTASGTSLAGLRNTLIQINHC